MINNSLPIKENGHMHDRYWNKFKMKAACWVNRKNGIEIMKIINVINDIKNIKNSLGMRYIGKIPI